LQRVADECGRLRRALATGRPPDPAPNAADDPVAPRPAIAELEHVVNLVDSTLESEDVPAEMAPLTEPRRLFVPDALTNPEYRRYALKGSLAVMICYVLQSAVDWPGIRTCIVTCMIVGLTSEGATIQKATLRFSGALVGGLLGFLSILLFIPSMVSITSLVLLVAAGAAIAGWVDLGSARISYAGAQIALAFFMCVIQGFAPEWHFDTIRDRLVGILLGNVVITLVFLYVWPVDAVTALWRNLAAALRTTARLATVEVETDDRVAMARRTAALRAQADRSFGAVQQSFEEAAFEPDVPGAEPGIRDALQRLTIGAQGVFLNQLAVARHRPDFAPGVLPPSLRSGIRRLDTAVAARLDAVADRIEGKAETPLPDLQAPLADLTRIAELFPRQAARPDVVAQVDGRLALYRVLVPRIERLSAERPYPGVRQ
jgi:multidrug resistance protein MdtO